MNFHGSAPPDRLAFSAVFAAYGYAGGWPAGLTCTAVSHRRAGAPGTNGAPNAHLPWRAAPGVRCKCRQASPQGAATRASWRSCWLSTWSESPGNKTRQVFPANLVDNGVWGHAGSQ
jgi:hypothetical protein